MAMFNSNIDYTKFIQFNGGTLRVATFVEIRDALVRRYKEIYGNDIDVSTASADGQYINEIALIINNIVNTFAYAYDQLDPSVATGKYLDILCSYNNVQRINQSASEAELYIFNSSPAGTPALKPEFLLFTDRNGQSWTWINGKKTGGELVTSFPAQEATLIQGVKCDYLGPIQALGSKFIDKNYPDQIVYTDDINKCDWSRQCPGCIYQLVNYNELKIWQYKDAIIGNEEETDEALRSRRYQMLGNQSVSVLEGLHASLLSISGIKDVFIMNNNRPIDKYLSSPVADGTEVLGHSIYIALRYKEGVNIDDSTIGTLIYNKLTPGIGTTPPGYPDFDYYCLVEADNNYYTSNTGGKVWINVGSEEPQYGEALDPVPTVDDLPTELYGLKCYTIQKTSRISYIIYWKKSQKYSPHIVMEINCNRNYDYPTVYCQVTGGNYYIWNGSSWVDTGSSNQPSNGTILDPVDSSGDLPSSVGAITDVEKNIVKNLQAYIDNIGIDSYMQMTQLLNVVQQSDRQKDGVSTFFVKSGTIGSNAATQQNHPADLHYFSYNDSDYKFAYTKSSIDMEYNDVCTITIG